MTTPTATRERARSAFAAAFLSLLFPGLGHAYARAWARALAFAAPPLLVLALGVSMVLNFGIDLIGLASREMLIALLGANLLAFLYRLVAAIDAYRVVAYTNRVVEGGRTTASRIGIGPARGSLAPLSIAGLAAVILVMAGSHVALANYNLLAIDTTSIFCSGSACDEDVPEPSVEASPGATAEETEPPVETLSPLPTLDPSASLPPAEEPSLPAWNGTGRLNVLLIGSDKRPKANWSLTDTLIVASIDPNTRQVAMFSLPRDVVDVPLPNIPARSVFGSVYAGKINGLYQQAKARKDLFPGGGYVTLKKTLSTLYKIPIHYFVEVDFNGFKQVVDAMGGVTINVQMPVVDDYYPGDRGALRVYIPTGIRHMTGAEALIYARSRHGSNDFDRSSRQQRVILSLRAQADFATLLERLPELVKSTKKTVKTDVPIDKLPQLLELASRIDIANVRSYVFAPPYYGTAKMQAPRGYFISPDIARIRTAVANAFDANPRDEAVRQEVAKEGAAVWVLNGTGQVGRAGRVAGYLDYRGLAASAPNQRPDISPATTVIRVYNGAESRMPASVALLEKLFKVTPKLVTDPAMRADIVVIVGAKTPKYQAPPAP
ncbi:MAG: cell envelope-related transcriptional attenuator [Chloroflexi bacterium]|nr:cell envelope-related transcriptional attenuator [Chloroflexota bacterium]